MLSFAAIPLHSRSRQALNRLQSHQSTGWNPLRAGSLGGTRTLDLPVGLSSDAAEPATFTVVDGLVDDGVLGTATTFSKKGSTTVVGRTEVCVVVWLGAAMAELVATNKMDSTTRAIPTFRTPAHVFVSLLFMVTLPPFI
jgi:hypothetical protein